MAELAADIDQPISNNQANVNTGHTRNAFIESVTEQTSNPASMAMLAGLIILGLTVIGWIVLVIANATYLSQIKTNEKAIASISTELNSGTLGDTNKTVTRLSKGIEQYKIIKSSNSNMSPLLEEFKVKVVPGTRLQRVSIAKDGQLEIDSQAKSYVDAAKLIASLKKSTFFSNIQVLNTSAGETGPTISLSSQYKAVKE